MEYDFIMCLGTHGLKMLLFANAVFWAFYLKMMQHFQVQKQVLTSWFHNLPLSQTETFKVRTGPGRVANRLFALIVSCCVSLEVKIQVDM